MKIERKEEPSKKICFWKRCMMMTNNIYMITMGLNEAKRIDEKIISDFRFAYYESTKMFIIQLCENHYKEFLKKYKDDILLELI